VAPTCRFGGKVATTGGLEARGGPAPRLQAAIADDYGPFHAKATVFRQIPAGICR